MDWLRERNSLSLQRLRLKENYVGNMIRLEKILDEYRFNLSKTKAIIGFSTATSNLIDLRETEPTSMIELGDFESKDMMSDQLFKLNIALPEEISITNFTSENQPRKRIVKNEPLNDSDNEISNGSEFDKEKTKPQTLMTYQFRPFGVLEPNSAKMARRNVHAALPLLCDLANLSAEIKSINNKIHLMDSTLKTIKKEEIM